MKKTPQEKKTLCYAKDRRNTYGENDKASRKLVPLRKARVNRGFRRKINEVLKSPEGHPLETADILEAQVRNIKREDWKKSADQPLGIVIEEKLLRRTTHAGNGKSARKKATEFLKAIEIETERELDGRWIAEAVAMNGVIAYGNTEENAIVSCKQLARIVFLEQLGSLEILSVNEGFTSVLIK
jgi:hypothetical protein